MARRRCVYRPCRLSWRKKETLRQDNIFFPMRFLASTSEPENHWHPLLSILSFPVFPTHLSLLMPGKSSMHGRIEPRQDATPFLDGRLTKG